MASQLPRSQAFTSSVLDPRRILDMNYTFASTAMLVAAVRLQLFIHIASEALTPTALAHTAPEQQVAERGLIDRYTWIEADMEVIEYRSRS